MEIDDELVREFLLESWESVNQLEQDFIALEKNYRDNERIASIFRCLHTMKGSCGFLNLKKMQALTHSAESLLAKIRDGKVELNTDIISVLLKTTDAIRVMLKQVESGKNDGDEPYTALIERFFAFANPSGSDASVPPNQALEIFEDLTRSNVIDTAIRVPVTLLDRIMNLVGELVLARNQILQLTEHSKDLPLIGATQRLNTLTSELQEGVMKTRMQPINHVWNKFPRVLRDLSQGSGKKAKLHMEGADTELDRSIIEAIRDPLTHAVRNAFDHGLEFPEERRSFGKSEEGNLKLVAFHEGGQVNIEISDDGRGIDPKRIADTALAQGLCTREKIAQLSEKDLINFIFHPGFSTASKVTNLSGRGVGMDVVKSNVEKIGGTVDVQTQVGKGTTLRIKIPLTLAIVPALIVRSGNERFAIPQINLLELVRLAEADLSRKFERINKATIYRLRGQLLPIVFLDQVLGLKPKRLSDDLHIVVLQADNKQFGLVVDEAHDSEEIVVKPLGKELKDLPFFSGATILGDGRVALIIDVMSLSQRTNIANSANDRIVEKRSKASAQEEQTSALLIVTAGKQHRFALPLSSVSRLEEIPVSQLEWAAGKRLTQYRGSLLEVLDLGEILGESPSLDETGVEKLPMVVHSHGNSHVGFAVSSIVDAVSERIEILDRKSQTGLLGLAILQGKVTGMVDVQGIVSQKIPHFYERAGATT